MPRPRAPHRCLTCPRLVPAGGGTRCGTCRPRTRTFDYSSRPWRRRSKDFLRRHPRCIDCGAPSTVSDHAPVARRDLVARGVPDPDADEHLQPRCAPCHNRRTVAVDGGFGNPRR